MTPPPRRPADGPDIVRQMRAGHVDWHVEHWPSPAPGAPVALLLHGTGASGHSWARMVPWLTPHFELVIPDLPGHARSRVQPGHEPSLPFIADALDALLAQLQVQPGLVIGHSAGAAVGAMLCLAGHVHPRALVSINGALLPLQGPVGRLFSPLAKLLVLNPLVPSAFAWAASWDGAAERLLAGTGSRLDADGVRAYRQLITDPAHAAGALRMMAAWDLRELERRLPTLKVPLALLASDGDLTVPPAHARQVAARVPGATLHRLPGLGHLAHEEDPLAVMRVLEGLGLLAPPG